MSYLNLSQFLEQQMGNLTPELAQVISTIAATCQTIDQALQKGALAGVLGLKNWMNSLQLKKMANI